MAAGCTRLFHRSIAVCLRGVSRVSARSLPSLAVQFSRFTLDSIAEVAFGFDLNSLHQEVPFARAFNEAQMASDRRFSRPWFQWMPFSSNERMLTKAIAVLDDFAYR